jgi:hypothetical protein
VAVEAEPEAVRFITEHGGSLWVYAVGDGLKQVKTRAPDDTGLRFEQIDADGFQLFIESDFVQPETWNVVLDHFPHQHVDVLWDGHQPGYARRIDPSNLPLSGIEKLLDL